MMAWTVETLDEAVDAELAALDADVRAKFVRTARMIAEFGIEAIREPYVKHLDGKLWEMRMIGRDGIARAIYVTAVGRRVVVLHAFVKKTRKTPRAALELARRRAKGAGLL